MNREIITNNNYMFIILPTSRKSTIKEADFGSKNTMRNMSGISGLHWFLLKDTRLEEIRQYGDILKGLKLLLKVHRVGDKRLLHMNCIIWNKSYQVDLTVFCFLLDEGSFYEPHTGLNSAAMATGSIILFLMSCVGLEPFSL